MEQSTMVKLEPVTATAPSYWAGYLINGDASGLTPAERRQADAFKDWLGADPIDCADAGFMWSHDAMRVCGAMAGDCQEYTALIAS
jgi:hypothetical protein